MIGTLNLQNIANALVFGMPILNSVMVNTLAESQGATEDEVAAMMVTGLMENE